MDWQPIETAPKGEKVLLYFPEKLDSRRERSHAPMHQVDYADAFPNRPPTHWKPLDAPSDKTDAPTLSE